MNNPTDAFPPIAQRGHAPLKGKVRRVSFGSSLVDPATKAYCFKWIQLGLLSKGELLDKMAKHCERTGFAITQLTKVLALNPPPSNAATVSATVNQTSKPKTSYAKSHIQGK